LNCSTVGRANDPFAHTTIEGTEEQIEVILERLREAYNRKGLDRIPPLECIETYAQSIQSKRRNLLLVAREGSFPPIAQNQFAQGSRIYDANYFRAAGFYGADSANDAYNWICSGLSYESNGCAGVVEDVKAAPDAWRVGDWPVEYCLSETPKERCKLHFQPDIAIIMTLFNAMKVAIMLFIAFRIRDEPLLNIGDAVVSFLGKTDTATRNACLSTIHSFKKRDGKLGKPCQWNHCQYRWREATSKVRRAVTIFLYVTVTRDILR
jgi:hypothetical protein